ncbi:Solute carrier family 10 member 6, partial [Trachymyrmex cornetzi]
RMAGVVYVMGLLLLGGASAWTVDIADNITVHMNQVISVPFSVHVGDTSRPSMWYFNTDQHIAKLSSEFTKSNGTLFSGIFNITGVFLGRTTLTFTVTEMTIKEDREVAVITVIREERIIDTVFTASVAILVSILYINFGCAIDWNVCRNTLRRPIGPAIGFFCQFLIMPLLSFLIGYLLFPDRPELQIGMFFTGISPSGGASNMWTLLLDGNLNLSITMTTICTIAAFVILVYKIIIIAGMGLPWLGFTFGFIIAYICKQPQADIRAIAIETGIQNTGVAIFLLRFTLKAPADDLTTVVPVSAAMMTPVPLTILFIIKLIYKYKQKKTAKGTLQSAPSLEKLQQTTNVSTQ